LRVMAAIAAVFPSGNGRFYEEISSRASLLDSFLLAEVISHL
jgi:hypothetical protein